MKKIITVGLLIMSTSSLFAQKISSSKVPAAVKSSFGTNFPGIKDVKWEMEHKNYEANFHSDGKTMSALFDPKGTWLETETDIKVSELPSNVVSYVKKNYKNASIKEAASIKKANGETNLEAEVNGKDLIFDKDGNFIKAMND
ncbi:MAG TPA: PepSY-like domain-containing protein [Flavipsychrobacter sp.]|nr:PepSY-like domain-containing protein [Flavipsychrobacter sp.]